MTTIVADLRDGSIYTDSRATYTSIRWTWKGRKKKIVGFEKSMKVFNLKGLLCASVGDVRGSNAILVFSRKRLIMRTIREYGRPLKDILEVL